MRVLKLKEKLGLFENTHGSTSVSEAEKILGCDEHREIARRSAMESAAEVIHAECHDPSLSVAALATRAMPIATALP